MKESRETLWLARISLLSEAKNLTAYVILFCVFLMIQFCFHGISSYLESTSGQMNVWELYIFFMASRTSQTLYFIGQILLSCSAFFFHESAAYYLVRTSKKRWVTSQLLYLLAVTIGYNIFIFLSLLLALGGNVSMENTWSNAMITAAQFSMVAIGGYPISIVSPSLLQTTPAQAGVITLLLSFLIGLLTGLIMIFAVSRKRTAIGFTVVAILWFADILIENNPVTSAITYVSPFGLSRIYRLALTGSGPKLEYAIIVLLLFVIILALNLYRAIRSIDFTKTG